MNMRTFLYFSSKARTSGNFDDLMQAGRMDIVCNVIIHTFFLSHKMRDDTNLHLIFYGSPDPPKHLEMYPSRVVPGTGVEGGNGKLDISKKDISGLIKRMLYKYRQGKKTEVWPGFFVEKRSFMDVVRGLIKEGKKVYILDKGGEDVRNMKTEDLDNAVFILGDHEGLPEKELRRLKKEVGLISVGNKMYFASQCVVLINNELDRREI